MSYDVAALAQRAKKAARALALADTQTKNRALCAAADALEQNAAAILAENTAKYGTVEDALTAYNTGKPGASAYSKAVMAAAERWRK